MGCLTCPSMAQAEAEKGDGDEDEDEGDEYDDPPIGAEADEGKDEL